MMKVHVYEKAWMIAAVGLVVIFVAAILATALAHGVHPPSHVETIDPLTARSDPRFARPGVHRRDDGTVEVVMLAQIWSFIPYEVRVPVDRPVTFRLTSPDLLHGFQVVGTNVNAMVVPGYVTQVTTTFTRTGEFLVTCNEYCGLGHHVMGSRIIVTSDWP